MSPPAFQRAEYLNPPRNCSALFHFRLTLSESQTTLRAVARVLMNARPLIILLSLGLIGAGCGNADKRANNPLAGKFFLSECPTGSVAPDIIDFRADGTCLVDAADRTGVAGKYEITEDDRLTIEADVGAWKEFNAPFELLKYTLTLQPSDGTTLIYVRMPDGPRPRFSEIIGTFFAHNDSSDSAAEITADHKFRAHLHDLMAEEHTYYDIQMDGTCSYSNGIVTYVPEHSDAPQQDKYLRDFIVKRDAKGLWEIDEFHDAIVCEQSATNLDLPPVPTGYQNAR